MSFPENRLALFLSRQCEACAAVRRMCAEIKGVDWHIVEVMPARTGQYQLVPKDVKDYPILFNKTQLPAVPALFDPTLKQLCTGFVEIKKYLVDSGLVDPEYDP